MHDSLHALYTQRRECFSNEKAPRHELSSLMVKKKNNPKQQPNQKIKDIIFLIFVDENCLLLEASSGWLGKRT